MTDIMLFPAATLTHESLQDLFETCLRLGAETELLPRTMYQKANSKKAALAKPVCLDREEDRKMVAQKFLPLRKFPFMIGDGLWSEEVKEALGLTLGTTVGVHAIKSANQFVHRLRIEFPTLPEYRERFDRFLAELRHLFSFDIVALENIGTTNVIRKISIRDREWFSEDEDNAAFRKLYTLVRINH